VCTLVVCAAEGALGCAVTALLIALAVLLVLPPVSPLRSAAGATAAAACRNHRGLRHYWGLRVKGQHTKTTGRRGKTVGVAKKR